MGVDEGPRARRTTIAQLESTAVRVAHWLGCDALITGEWQTCGAESTNKIVATSWLSLPGYTAFFLYVTKDVST